MLRASAGPASDGWVLERDDEDDGDDATPNTEATDTPTWCIARIGWVHLNHSDRCGKGRDGRTGYKNEARLTRVERGRVDRRGIDGRTLSAVLLLGGIHTGQAGDGEPTAACAST